MSIHPTAIVSSHAEIHPSAEIGPYCVIDSDVRIESGCRLYQQVYVTGWTTIEPNVELHPGAVIGHTPQDIKHTGGRSFCRIGRGTIVREYASVHRGTMPESQTIVGANCFLLGNSHVAHNCRIGDGVTLINNVLLGGHVEIGPGAVLGGAVAVHQFVRIGERAMIAGVARVPMDVPPFALIDAQGRVAGLNRVGMRRAGMSREEMDDIRSLYRLLYGRGTQFSGAAQSLGDYAKTEAGRRLAQFLRGESRRGIAGSSRYKRPLAGDEM